MTHNRLLLRSTQLPVRFRVRAMRREKIFVAGAIALGLFAFAVVLAYHQIADGDLWARLAVGRHFFATGGVIRQDVFAFTPTLPEWIDHEWGAGVIFYALWPVGLMALKIVAGCATLGVAVIAARRGAPGGRALPMAGRAGCPQPAASSSSWPGLLLLAIPCAVTVLPGFVPVVRSHVFTYFFFALTLLCLEAGKPWFVVPVMLVWANVHGGFIVGLIAMALYRRAWPALLASVAVTLVNPWGIRYWSYLVPAWLHPRPDIPEWGAMPVWGLDANFGFRLMFVVAVVAALAGRGRISVSGWVMLGLTAAAGWLHRRHAPFFGIAALVYLAPAVEAKRVPVEFVAGLYAAIAVAVGWRFLPASSLMPATPEGFYPVKAVEMLQGKTGNLAVPFRWGSYASWRLWPGAKVSMDGRYEEVYPDATFEMNRDFFYRQGKDWDRLLRQHKVDFIILELRTTQVELPDLEARGYRLVWADERSALLER